MKKIISLLLVACMALSISACSAGGSSSQGGTDAGSSLQTDESTGDSETARYDEGLLKALENAVYTTQPGTAGTSLKAVYAVKDVLRYLKENRPDAQTIIATVGYLFENSEYADEAAEAFESMKSVYDAVKESDTAQKILDEVRLAAEDFEVPREISELFDAVIARAEKYSE